ncbi:MAG: SURF1 family protein [Steroidobacteraceae bacterium]
MREYSPVLNRGRSRFAPRPVATVATVAAVVLFAALGEWQLGRATEKRALAAEFARAGPALEWRQLPSEAPRFQRVSVRGRYDTDRQFLLDNMSHAGRPGVQVLTPLLLADGSAVLVNRGWLPFGATREDLPEVPVGDELRAITGRIDELPRPPIELAAEAPAGWPKLVQYPRIKELSDLLDRDLDPRVILLDPAEPEGFVRAWTVPGTPPTRHLAYAVQWFAFAALAVAIWLVLSLRRTGDAT